MLSELSDRLAPAEQEALEDLLHKMLRGTQRTRREAQYACRLCDHTVCVGDECPIGASVTDIPPPAS